MLSLRLAKALSSSFILKLSCVDQPGIVHAVTKYILSLSGTIIESAQYGDGDTKLFFMRIHFAADASNESKVKSAFEAVAKEYQMNWELQDADAKPRIMIMVSKFDHCLVDLLYRVRIGELEADVPVVVSNHLDSKDLVEAQGVRFEHIPITKKNKLEQEVRLLEIVKSEKIDFVVLARYMQILSSQLCDVLDGRVINIHHSFLPGFKGAKPYHQAHERGVKIIGATAHYVTSDLDEGPIIEQDVLRVTHAQSPKDLVRLGRDLETRVLARAVRLQVNKRVIRNENKTIVFS